ncbi:MAG: hypothetical protein ACK5B9_12125 [Flavobacteriia bacterium]|jgi:hypothetical protein
MKLFCTLVICLLLNSRYSQTSDSLNKGKQAKLSFFKSFKDSTNKHNHFELSFGQNLLFISESKKTDVYNEEAIILPTSSVLFFSEFRPQKVMRIPVFLNIATESKQYIVNGQLKNEKANPTIGAGLVFKMLQYNMDAKSKVELELGGLGSVIFAENKNVRVAPILAMRLKICRGENFVMYLGGNYSFGVKAFGLMYGTGTVF